MFELAEPLRRVLGETGYLTPDGRPAAPTVTICNGDERERGTLKPDVRWEDANLKVEFKFAESPSPQTIGTWQREVWNKGAAPLLWVVEPDQTTLYNGFAEPQPGGSVAKAQLDTFHHNGTVMAHGSGLGLADLSTRAGLLAMETGTFWHKEKRVNRRNAVDARLLSDIALLESELRYAGLSLDRAQGLIGRAIFAQYLVDRGIIAEPFLRDEFDGARLPAILANRPQASRLFRFLVEKFNGDMFPSTGVMPAGEHLEHVASFLKGEATGQGSLFPYRFDLIPVELISAIYEQFVHSADANHAGKQDVHYTPLAAVSLIMDEVMQDITGEETVLDITCGSGVFLVEALRRLVDAKVKAQSGERTRDMVRQALEQVFGVDKSEAAIQVAAFSLYLAALEFDPDPWNEVGLQFAPLRGKTLHVKDAHDVDLPTKFDIIVGNPPWSFGGKSATADRRSQRPKEAKSPRGRSFDFANRAKELAADNARFGMLLSASPFFATSETGRRAAQELVQSLSPVTLIDLSSQQWLFRNAKMPAMGLIARYRPQQDPEKMALVRVPWSHAAKSGHTLKVASSDVKMLHLESWRRNPALFKSGFVGRLHDHLLLEDLCERHWQLKDRLAAVGTAFYRGLTWGDGRKDATFLRDMPLLDKTSLRRLSLRAADLPRFEKQSAERPRAPNIYEAPLLIVRENLRKSPRPVVAVTNADVVYTQSFYGASFPREHSNLANLLAGILSSSFAAWYLYAAGPHVGVWKRRVLEGTANTIPVPDLVDAAATSAGRRVVDIVDEFQQRPGADDPADDDYGELDGAVAELYEFGASERMVIQDGLLRASWDWQEGWLESDRPVGTEHLRAYAEAFVSKFDAWFHAAKKRRLCATVYETTALEPIRVIRFVLQRRAPPSEVHSAPAGDPMAKVLADACTRLNEPSAMDDFARNGEVRLENEREIVVAKPSARRLWLTVNALADARAALDQSPRSEVA